MTFTAPLGLLALLGVPAVVFLHLYRRRLRERFRPHLKEEAMKSTQTVVLRVHAASIGAESRDLVGRSGKEKWCERGDSNPHTLAGTRT